MLCGLCKSFLEKQNKTTEYFNLYEEDINNLEGSEIILQAKNAHTIVVSGCCYINTYPAHTTLLLESLAKSGFLKNQKLYGIIQGGMPYEHTHKSGLNMLEIFAKETGIKYCGGFIMGLGAMLDGKSLENLPNGKKVAKQFSIFLTNILNGEVSQATVYRKSIIKLPNFVAKILVNFMNKAIDNSYKELGLDPYAPTPYLNDKLS